MKKVVATTIALSAVVGIGGYFALQKMEESYQRWADCTRVNDVYYVAELIEEFKGKKGYYPLGASYLEPDPEGWVSVPVMVNISHRELPEQYRHMPGNTSGRVAPTSEFEQELSEGLGRTVQVPHDPQNVPTHAPNFYQYLIFPDGHYVLTAYLYTPNDFTTRLGEHYFKYSVGSEEISSPKNRVLKFTTLGVKPQRCPR